MDTNDTRLGSNCSPKAQEKINAFVAGILGNMGHDKNAKLQNSAPRIARFIYRGFHNTSGGGNPMLNNEEGVTPRAFLPGQAPMPKTMRDIPAHKLAQFVANHVNFMQDMATPFSSWSPDLGTALYFATGQFARHTSAVGAGKAMDLSQCSIAVVDTWKMFSERTRPYRILPVAALGLARCGCEYLVYGPVQGFAYTVVRLEDIQRAVGCSLWPCCPTRNPMPHPLTPGELREARDMSKLFNGSKAMELTVFLAEICRQQWASPAPGELDPKLAELAKERRLIHWDHSIKNRLSMLYFLSGCKDLVSSRDMIPLSNRSTYTRMMGQLQLSLSATFYVENMLRRKLGFEGVRNQLSEEQVEFWRPFLSPQEHFHDCGAPKRTRTKVTEDHELAFLKEICT